MNTQMRGPSACAGGGAVSTAYARASVGVHLAPVLTRYRAMRVTPTPALRPLAISCA
jgi:hypothetical protein